MATRGKAGNTQTSAAQSYASAMDKLRDEMANFKGPHPRYVQVVGEYLTNYLLEHPEAEAALLNSAKTIHGSLKDIEAEARKNKEGNVGIIGDVEAFGIVLKYFGITEGTGNRQQATGEKANAVGASPCGRPPQAPDPFDLDALLASGIAGLSPSDPKDSPGETRDAQRGGALLGVTG